MRPPGALGLTLFVAPAPLESRASALDCRRAPEFHGDLDPGVHIARVGVPRDLHLTRAGVMPEAP